MLEFTCNHAGCLPDGSNSSRTDYHIDQIAWNNTENNPESKDWESTQTSRLAELHICLLSLHWISSSLGNTQQLRRIRKSPFFSTASLQFANNCTFSRDVGLNLGSNWMWLPHILGECSNQHVFLVSRLSSEKILLCFLWAPKFLREF